MAYVDWEFAKTTGRTLVPAGPGVTRAAGRDGGRRDPCRRVGGPHARSPRRPGSRRRTDAPDALVVDRATWIGVNADSMSAMLDPTFDAIVEKRGETPNATVQAFGSKVTGAEAGALLAFMASKVLGQYDLAPGGTPALMLVAPNIMAVAEELDVDRDDFRRWVCMHEETHRVQFTANPWLRDHLVAEARALAVELAPDQDRLQEIAGRVAEKLPDLFRERQRGRRRAVHDPGAARAPRRAHRRHVAARGPRRRRHGRRRARAHPDRRPDPGRFTQRRKGAGAPDRLLRRLLGLEAKMRQYRDGAVFVRGVRTRSASTGFNAVWASPDTLPLAREIADPQAWVRRVHG